MLSTSAQVHQLTGEVHALLHQRHVRRLSRQ